MKTTITTLVAILSLTGAGASAADLGQRQAGFLHEGRYVGNLWRGPGDTPYYRIDRSGHEKWSGTRHFHRHGGHVAVDRSGRRVGVVTGGRLVHPTYSYDNGYYGGDYYVVEPRVVGR